MNNANNNNTNQQTLQNPHVTALMNELDALKKELKRTRGGWKRLWLNNEIRSVAAQLAKYMD